MDLHTSETRERERERQRDGRTDGRTDRETDRTLHQKMLLHYCSKSGMHLCIVSHLWKPILMILGSLSNLSLLDNASLMRMSGEVALGLVTIYWPVMQKAFTTAALPAASVIKPVLGLITICFVEEIRIKRSCSSAPSLSCCLSLGDRERNSAWKPSSLQFLWCECWMRSTCAIVIVACLSCACARSAQSLCVCVLNCP